MFSETKVVGIMRKDWSAEALVPDRVEVTERFLLIADEADTSNLDGAGLAAITCAY